MRSFVLCFFLLISQWSYGQVSIAFFANKMGAELDNSELYHTAISYQGQWFHAYIGGVRLVSASYLQKRLYLKSIITIHNYNEPSHKYVEENLGKKFHVIPDWDNPDIMDCSKLIAQWLKIRPKEMTFGDSHWSDEIKNEYRGKLGLSPKDIFKALTTQKRFDITLFDENFILRARKQKYKTKRCLNAAKN